MFDLPLELRDGKATALRISLPPHFPQVRRVCEGRWPAAAHAWLGTNGRCWRPAALVPHNARAARPARPRAQERPSLSVLLPVVHPSVDTTGRLHTPGLSSWTYGQSQLADAVAEAVATLTSAVVDARQPGAAGAGRGGEW